MPRGSFCLFKLTANKRRECLIEHMLILTYIDHEAVEVDNRINGLQRTRLPQHISSSTASVTSEISVDGTSTPYNSWSWACMSRIVMLRAFIARIMSIYVL